MRDRCYNVPPEDGGCAWGIICNTYHLVEPGRELPDKVEWKVHQLRLDDLENYIYLCIDHHLTALFLCLNYGEPRNIPYELYASHDIEEVRDLRKNQEVTA